MVQVLEPLAVGVGGAQDERAGIQPAVTSLGMFERLTKRAVAQVVKRRVVAE